MYEFGYGINDAFWRVIWAIDEETIWAENFSEESFEKVKLGMTSDEVLSVMGKPLNDIEKCEGGCFWTYTGHARGNADFDQRWIVFDANNKVSEIRKSFFID